MVGQGHANALKYFSVQWQTKGHALLVCVITYISLLLMTAHIRRQKFLAVTVVMPHSQQSLWNSSYVHACTLARQRLLCDSVAAISLFYQCQFTTICNECLKDSKIAPHHSGATLSCGTVKQMAISGASLSHNSNHLGHFFCVVTAPSTPWL